MAVVPGDVVRLPVPRIDLRRAVRQRLAERHVRRLRPAGRLHDERARAREDRERGQHATAPRRRRGPRKPLSLTAHASRIRCPRRFFVAGRANSRRCQPGAAGGRRAYTRGRCRAASSRSPARHASVRSPSPGPRPRRRRSRRPDRPRHPRPGRRPAAGLRRAARLRAALAAARHVGPPALGAVRRGAPAAAPEGEPDASSGTGCATTSRRSRSSAPSAATPRRASSPTRSSRRGRRTSRRSMRKELRARTLRVLVQGHLSQHLIFHSLHQEAGPEAAAKLFGVRSTEAFQRLRRLDLSPLRIGRTHGRTRAQMQHGLERELRTAARDGVAGGDTSARQAQIVLQRQLRQVPRWLGEDHYNGPPQTTGGKLRYAFRPSFASPAISGDGSVVLFDAQQPAPPLAVRYGEVVLEGRNLTTGAQLDPRDASIAAIEDRPCSSYGPSLSDGGQRIAYEMSAGNRTFAKRYGNVVVAVADVAAGTVRVVAGGYDGARVETAYDPALSDDGNVVAYESVIADPMSPSTSWATRVRVRDLRAGRRDHRPPRRRLRRSAVRQRPGRGVHVVLARAPAGLRLRPHDAPRDARQPHRPRRSARGRGLGAVAVARRHADRVHGDPPGRRARPGLRPRPPRARRDAGQRRAPRLRARAVDLGRRAPRRLRRAAGRRRRRAPPGARRSACSSATSPAAPSAPSATALAPAAAQLVRPAAQLERRRARRLHDRRGRRGGRRPGRAARHGRPTSDRRRSRRRARRADGLVRHGSRTAAARRAPLQPRPAGVVRWATAAAARARRRVRAWRHGRARPPVAQLGGWLYNADPSDVGLRSGWVERPPAIVPVTVPSVANACAAHRRRGRALLPRERRLVAHDPGGRRGGPLRRALRIRPSPRDRVDRRPPRVRARRRVRAVRVRRAARPRHACGRAARQLAPARAPAAPGLRPGVVQLGRDRLAGERRARRRHGAARSRTSRPSSGAARRVVTLTAEVRDTRTGGAPAPVAVDGRAARAASASGGRVRAGHARARRGPAPHGER